MLVIKCHFKHYYQIVLTIILRIILRIMHGLWSCLGHLPSELQLGTYYCRKSAGQLKHTKQTYPCKPIMSQPASVASINTCNYYTTIAYQLLYSYPLPSTRQHLPSLPCYRIPICTSLILMFSLLSVASPAFFIVSGICSYAKTLSFSTEEASPQVPFRTTLNLT